MMDHLQGFLTRPQEVGAIRYNGTKNRALEIVEWVTTFEGVATYRVTVKTQVATEDQPRKVVKTDQLIVLVEPTGVLVDSGDWVVLDRDNNWSVLSNDDFNQLYYKERNND